MARNKEPVRGPRIAFVGDPHIHNFARFGGALSAGINARAKVVLSTIDAAIGHAARRGADVFVGCGDIFETANPSPALIAAAQGVFARTEAIVIPGNHDRESDARGDNALAPLRPVATVVEEPAIVVPRACPQVALLCVPYKSGHGVTNLQLATRELASQLPDDRECTRVLVFHLGIEDESTKPYLRGVRDSIPLDVLEELMEECSITYSFCGNWHDHKHRYVIDGRRGVVQCGTLTPSSWKDEGIDRVGIVSLFSPTRVPHVEMFEQPGPRFVTVRNSPEAEALFTKLRKSGEHTIFVRYVVDEKHERFAAEEIEEWVAAGAIAGGHVSSVVTAAAEVAAEAAAEVARKSETDGEALEAFIAAMPLPDNVDRVAVLDLARTYLNA